MSEGFVMVPNQLLNTDPYTRSVYMAIKSHFPNCYPSIRRIQEVSRASRPTVIKRIKQLVAMGLLKVVNGRRGQSNKYHLPEETLTPAEAEAQRRGTWKNIKWRDFLRPKKVVNAILKKKQKVVNVPAPNKNSFKQEDFFESPSGNFSGLGDVISRLSACQGFA